MNPTLETLDSPQAQPAAAEPAEPGGPDDSHRGRGKIARLPRKMREQVNRMLEDGVPYAKIKESLGDHGKDLTPNNISEWKKRGYQQWLKQQFWREEMRARMDAFTDPLGETDPTHLSIVGLQMSLTQLCEQLRDMGPRSHKDQFEADADKYLRMLNTLSRLSKSLLALQQFQRKGIAGASALQALHDPKRKKLKEEENRNLVLMVDDILGLPSDDDDSPANAPAPPTPESQPAIQNPAAQPEIPDPVTPAVSESQTFAL